MFIGRYLEKLNLQRGGLCLIPVYCLSAPNLFIVALFLTLELHVVDISPLPASMVLSFASKVPGGSLQEKGASFSGSGYVPCY